MSHQMFENEKQKVLIDNYTSALQECAESFEKDFFPIPRFIRHNDDGTMMFIVYYEEDSIISTANPHAPDMYIQFTFNVSDLDGSVNHVVMDAGNRDEGPERIFLSKVVDLPKDFNMFASNDLIVDAYHQFKSSVTAFIKAY